MDSRSLLKHIHEVSHVTWPIMHSMLCSMRLHTSIQQHVVWTAFHQRRHLQAMPMSQQASSTDQMLPHLAHAVVTSQQRCICNRSNDYVPTLHLMQLTCTRPHLDSLPMWGYTGAAKPSVGAPLLVHCWASGGTVLGNTRSTGDQH